MEQSQIPFLPSQRHFGNIGTFVVATGIKLSGTWLPNELLREFGCAGPAAPSKSSEAYHVMEAVEVLIRGSHVIHVKERGAIGLSGLVRHLRVQQPPRPQRCWRAFCIYLTSQSSHPKLVLAENKTGSCR